jgi:hypothetical protein
MKALEQKFTKIPKGYRITIESYENDMDFGDTTVVEGISEEEVKQVVSLCTVMQTEEYANLYYPRDRQKVKLFNILNTIFDYISDCVVTIDNLDEYEDDFCNILSEYGFIGKAEDQFTRYCQSYKIEYLPEDIFIEDVTEKFGF